MCFSATASFAAGGALTAIGGATLAKAKKRSELPFAAIPLLFGIQQLIEGIIWLSFGAPAVQASATFAYAIFSQVLWPIWIPLAIMLLEPDPSRKKILGGFFLVGLGVGSYVLYFTVTSPITATLTAHSIAYTSSHAYPLATIALYIAATCMSCLFSSHRMVKLFGTALFASFLLSYRLYSATLFSVWCFFAALTSIIVYLHFKKGRILKR